ncbi:MAG: iron-sulfur cluster assembly protein [Acidobacteriota bacterium]
MHPGEKLFIEQRAYEALRTVFGPEIPVNIYELGLVSDVIGGESSEVNVRMTLATRDCPVAQSLPVDVEKKVRGVEGDDGGYRQINPGGDQDKGLPYGGHGQREHIRGKVSDILRGCESGSKGPEKQKIGDA